MAQLVGNLTKAIGGGATAHIGMAQAALPMAVRGIAAAGRALGQVVQRFSEHAPRIMGVSTGAFASAGAGLLQLGAQGTSIRLQTLAKRAATEGSRSISQAVTGRDPGIRGAFAGETGTQYGFAPAQSNAILSSFLGGIGNRTVANANRGEVGVSPFAAIRRGENANLIASLLSKTATGAGASGGGQNAARMITGIRGSLFGMGYRASGIDKFMSALDSMATRLQGQGGTLNLASANAAFSREGVRGLGSRAIPVMQSFSGDAMSQRGQLLQPFKQLEQAKMLSRAFAGGGSIADIAGRLENLAGDPDEIFGRMEGMSDEGRMAYNMSRGEARGFQRGAIVAGGPTGRERQSLIASRGVSRTFAEHEASTIGAVDPAGLAPMLRQVDMTNRVLIRISEQLDRLRRPLETGLRLLGRLIGIRI